MVKTNTARHWKRSIPLLWNIPKVVDSLERRLFKPLKAVRILDCACGTGDFAVEIARRGYQVDCSDADKNMVALTEELSRMSKLRLNLKVAYWQTLSNSFSGGYDVVMIRGNSLPYVISWENQDEKYLLDVEKADDNLILSFKAVYEQLKDGGVFYFDMRHIYEREGKEKVGEGKMNGEKAALIFDVSYHKGFLRRIVSELKIGNNTERRIYNSYHLPFIKLDDLLQEAGFKFENIKHCVGLNGENVYSPFFVGRK